GGDEARERPPLHLVARIVVGIRALDGVPTAARCARDRDPAEVVGVAVADRLAVVPALGHRLGVPALVASGQVVRNACGHPVDPDAPDVRLVVDLEYGNAMLLSRRDLRLELDVLRVVAGLLDLVVHTTVASRERAQAYLDP